MRISRSWPLHLYLGMLPWVLQGSGYDALRRYRGRVRLRVRDVDPAVGLVDGQTSDVPLMRLLIEAGILMMPDAVIWKSFGAWQFGAWYPVLRYANAFEADSLSLKLADHMDRVDDRLRAITSEELAVGYCGHVLRASFGVSHIADAAPLIGKELAPTTAGTSRPDFLCRKLDGTLVIAEAKGTLGGMRKLSPRMRQGKSQVEAVTPVKPLPVERVVVGLGLTTTNERAESVGAVHDPPEAEGAETFELDTEALVRHSYAKVFSSMSLYEHARRLVEGEAWFQIPEEPVGTFEVRGTAYVAPAPLAELQMAQNDEIAFPLLGLRRDIYDVLATGSNVEGRVDDVLATNPPPRSEQDEDAIYFNNGLVVR